jgi:hypothetical protein
LTLSCEEIVLALRSNCPLSVTPSHLSGREASAEATLADWIPLQPQKDSIRGKVAHCVRLAGSHLVKGRELTFSLSHRVRRKRPRSRSNARLKQIFVSRLLRHSSNSTKFFLVDRNDRDDKSFPTPTRRFLSMPPKFNQAYLIREGRRNNFTGD